MQNIRTLKHPPGESGWRLPGTAALWVLPVFVPWLAVSEPGIAVSGKLLGTLTSGSASAAAIVSIGVWAAWYTRSQADSPGRRWMLRSMLTTAAVFGIATIVLANNGELIYAALAPGLTWILAAFLVPFWRDDEQLVDFQEPESGWKRIWGLRLVYCDRANAAVWVRMRTDFPFSLDMGYTPNLGHLWGRLALGMIFLPLGLGLLVGVMAG